MSDQEEFEYFDEAGNPVDPSDLAEYEVVDEAPAVTPPAPSPPQHRIPKALIAIGAVGVLAIGGGIAYGLHNLGNESTAADVRAGVSSKAASASSAYRSESSAVESSVRQAIPIRACQGDVEKAGPSGDLEMRILSYIDLPPSMTGRIKPQIDEEASRVQMVQTAPSDLGVYWDERDAPLSKTGWWKVSVETGTGRPVIAGEAPGTGHDVPYSGACKAHFDSGLYRVTGKGIPLGAKAAGVGTAPMVNVAALMVDGSSGTSPVATDDGKPQIVWLVVRDRLLRTQLVRPGDDTESSSPAASTEPADGEG